jgi:predicted TIM-barrel fold metal-dependent hydrolase
MHGLKFGRICLARPMYASNRACECDPVSTPTRAESAVVSRLQRIDFHQHFVPEIAARYVARVSADTGWIFPPENIPWSPDKSLSFMDQLGITTAILSLTGSPGGEGVGTANRDFARQLNLFAHQVVAEHPGRFGFFANIPIPTDTDAALEELAFALDELDADGVNLTSSYGTGNEARYVADDAFDPIWEELDRRAAVVFLHGEQTPNSNRYPSALIPISVGEVPNETYKAAAHLVTSGKKRRYANVKIVLSHAGGSAPYLAGRVAVLSRHQGCQLTPEEVIDDFRTFYYDIALAGFDTTLVAQESFVQPDRIVFGTDFPAVNLEMAQWYTRHADDYFGNRDRDLQRLMHDNALALLPRLRAKVPPGRSE